MGAFSNDWFEWRRLDYAFGFIIFTGNWLKKVCDYAAICPVLFLIGFEGDTVVIRKFLFAVSFR